MAGISGVIACIATIFVVSVALVDLWRRRIPNFLVIPAAGAGLALNFYREHWSGLGFGLKGLGVGFALLILPYALGGMKAGDVKFLAAIGAFLGASDVFRALLATLLIYPLFAAYAVIKAGKLQVTWLRFRRVLYNFLGVIAPGMKLYAQRLEGLDDPSVASATTPFGVSIAVGTLIAIYTRFLR
jgi:prepilin peptidase CpaA